MTLNVTILNDSQSYKMGVTVVYKAKGNICFPEVIIGPFAFWKGYITDLTEVRVVEYPLSYNPDEEKKE
jgi:hypothetical protein